MHQAAAQPAATTDAFVDARPRRREVARFLRTAVPFCIGLVLTVVVVDALLGWRTARSDGKRVIGRDVREAIQAARRPGPGVTTLYLGDSVARQLFLPSSEPRPDVRYVTSNFAVALAGQHYLLDDALKRCPDVREVNLVMVIGVWGNDLDSVFTDDYFCGHFHSAAQVAEVFRLKRDWRLSTVHASRWLLPNLLAHNAARRPQAPVVAPAEGHVVEGWLAPAGGEPILTVLSRLVPPPPPVAPVPPAPQGYVAVPLSRVSRHYLDRMRTLCASRGVLLRIVPGPCPDTYRFADTAGIYDGEIFYVDHNKFSDGIHIRREHLDAVRAELMKRYVDPAAGSSPARRQR